MRTRSILLAGILLLVAFANADAAPAWREYAEKPREWYQSADGIRVTTNVLSWQSPHGSWPKNGNTASQPYTGDPEKLSGTFDNGATVGELRFLAQAYRVAGDSKCQAAFLKGVDAILKAQYPSGGWPQFYPPDAQYHRHITFNDGTMVRLMEFLRELAESPGYAFVDAARRKSARASFDRGIQCILKCQIVVNNQPTVWCAQHDELNYSPRSGRTYELVSLSGAESAGILHLLMSLDQPSPDVARAIEAGVAWFERAKIAGIRVSRINGERVVINDPSAPPLWARFYEVETNRPIFSGRDGVRKYTLAEIERERRNGYAWYGNWGEAIAVGFSKWKLRSPAPSGP